MQRTFSGATRFGMHAHPANAISRWDTSKVEVMDHAFENAKSFNTFIGGWDVARVHSMTGMLAGASSFNQRLSKDCTSGPQASTLATYQVGCHSQGIDPSAWERRCNSDNGLLTPTYTKELSEAAIPLLK